MVLIILSSTLDQLAPKAQYYLEKSEPELSPSSYERRHKALLTIARNALSLRELDPDYKPINLESQDRALLEQDKDANQAYQWVMGTSPLSREQLSKKAQYLLLETDELEEKGAHGHYINLISAAKGEIRAKKTVSHKIVQEILSDKDATQALRFITKDLPKKDPASLRACALAAIASNHFDTLGKRTFYENLPNEVGENILSLYYGLYALLLDEKYEVWNEYWVNSAKNLFVNQHVLQAAAFLRKYDVLLLIRTSIYDGMLFNPELVPHLIDISINHEDTFTSFYGYTKNCGTPQALALVEAAYQKYYVKH